MKEERPVFVVGVLLATFSVSGLTVDAMNPHWPVAQRIAVGLLLTLVIMLTLIGVLKLLLLLLDIADRPTARARRLQSLDGQGKPGVSPLKADDPKD